MLLHDSLDDAVADVFADLPSLADTSRRRGIAIRRRRRALSAVGATAAASALVIGIWAVAPGSGGGPEREVATDVAAPVAAGPLGGDVAPITGRGTAAALASAVDEAADGTFGGFQGDAYDHEAFAAVRFLPESGSGPAGLVMVNLQPLGMAGAAPYTCAQIAPSLTDCEVKQLPNGDTLRSYRGSDSEFGAGAEVLTVEVISPERRLRLVVNALNTNPYADGAMRTAPVLTADQLIAVATQPWWDRDELPEEFVAAGAELQDYSSATTEAS